jgi:4-hydroxy-3-polyprenylbenzoate decarboxylase
MGYRSLRECVDDLERHGQLVRIDSPVDARLEAAAIHRRVHAAGGPAIYYANVTGCRFPMVSNLFGTMDRVRLMFRDSLAAVGRLIALKVDPQAALVRPWQYWRTPLDATALRPKFVRTGLVMAERTSLSQLPRLQSWPHDGGPFITLPVAYTEDVRAPGLGRSNLGMYRVQLAGSRYEADREVGLHYQIHRSIGVHHAAAREAGQPFRVNIFVGGPPAMSVAAVMPLPEGMSELGFAGALGGRRVHMVRRPDGLPIHADSDFCITGVVDPERLLPEGPFGDHLGYYSLAHPFPVLKVSEVYCRQDAIWPFTVVGRPPQEDTMFGQLIHELTGPLIPTVLPGIHAVHAVDAAGVHPLLLAIGSERYAPFAEAAPPQELLTQASAILGQGQLSLAKFLLIASRQDDPQLDVYDVAAFLRHVLERADWQRDLHFHTQTTMDTLDYSGVGLNAGSKVVIAARGPKRFDLATAPPANLPLADDFRNPRVIVPGVLAIEGPACPQPSLDYEASLRVRDESREQAAGAVRRLCAAIALGHPINQFRWIVVVDDSRFVGESLRNFLWVAFTRTNPADDVYGVGEFVSDKHWGCRGALVVDARIKPHHAPVLEEDPEISRRVDALGAPGQPLHGII